MRPLAVVLLRIALCAAVTYAVWRVFGVFAFIFCAPLFGIALARPLQELVAAGARGAKERALEEVQGRYYAHRGVPLDIAEDDEDQRWLRTQDVRKIVPGLPRDEVLAKLYAERAGVVEGVKDFRIRADALAEHLRNAQDASAVKFKVWIEREVLLGARLKG